MLMWTIAEMHIPTFTIPKPLPIIFSIWPEHRSKAAEYYEILHTAHPRQHKNSTKCLPSHTDHTPGDFSFTSPEELLNLQTEVELQHMQILCMQTHTKTAECFSYRVQILSSLCFKACQENACLLNSQEHSTVPGAQAGKVG